MQTADPKQNVTAVKNINTLFPEAVGYETVRLQRPIKLFQKTRSHDINQRY
jgi:hypothetical protein